MTPFNTIIFSGIFLIILILGYVNLLLVKKMITKLAIIPIMDERWISPDNKKELINLIIKLRYDLNRAVNKNPKGELKIVIKSDIYTMTEFENFLESLKRLGYSLSTELYYGKQYLLIIQWDRAQYV